MTKGCDYKVYGSQQRFAERAIIHVHADESVSSLETGNRTFVPFAGFDGQKLAGSGALVWEGELLKEHLH